MPWCRVNELLFFMHGYVLFQTSPWLSGKIHEPKPNQRYSSLFSNVSYSSDIMYLVWWAERAALLSALGEWQGAFQSTFHSSGFDPYLADLAVYGVLRSVQGFKTHKWLLDNATPGFNKWWLAANMILSTHWYTLEGVVTLVTYSFVQREMDHAMPDQVKPLLFKRCAISV